MFYKTFFLENPLLIVATKIKEIERKKKNLFQLALKLLDVNENVVQVFLTFDRRQPVPSGVSHQLSMLFEIVVVHPLVNLNIYKKKYI